MRQPIIPSIFEWRFGAFFFVLFRYDGSLADDPSSVTTKPSKMHGPYAARRQAFVFFFFSRDEDSGFGCVVFLTIYLESASSSLSSSSTGPAGPCVSTRTHHAPPHTRGRLAVFAHDAHPLQPPPSSRTHKNHIRTPWTHLTFGHLHARWPIIFPLPSPIPDIPVPPRTPPHTPLPQKSPHTPPRSQHTPPRVASCRSCF